MSAPAPAPSPDSRSTRPLRWLWLLVPLAAIAVWLVFFRGAATPEPVKAPRERVPVRAEAARTGDFVVQSRVIGTVTPFNTVTVRSRVDGQLARVLVREGEQVARGQLLAEIDPEPLRVALAQAQGQQAQNLAQLKSAESDLTRYQGLFQRDAIARQRLEQQSALVQQLRGTIQSDDAQVKSARLQLSYTRIVAPIAGRVGLRRVDAGNLITANDANGLFTLTQTQPVAVVFNVPEPQVPDVRAAHAGKTAPVAEAWDRDNRRRIATGQLDTLDNQIDAGTGTLRLKARFANADDALFPNQFVNVRLALRTIADAVTIPADAVQHGSRGSHVYVVVDGKSMLRPVRLGPSDGGRSVVLDGVKAGEPVVVEGLDRLEDGREVVLVETPALSSSSPLATPAASDASR